MQAQRFQQRAAYSFTWIGDRCKATLTKATSANMLDWRLLGRGLTRWMSVFALVHVPDKCWHLAEVLEAEFADVQLLQVIEFFRVGWVVPGWYLVLAKNDRLHHTRMDQPLIPFSTPCSVSAQNLTCLSGIPDFYSGYLNYHSYNLLSTLQCRRHNKVHPSQKLNYEQWRCQCRKVALKWQFRFAI